MCSMLFSAVALISATVTQVLFCRDLQGKPICLLPFPSYWSRLQRSYYTNSYQAVGYGPSQAAQFNFNGVDGAYNLCQCWSHNQSVIIGLRFYRSKVRGALCPQPTSTELTMVAGVLMLLTVYKLLSYCNQSNRTWAAPTPAHTGWSIEHVSLRITVLARDSIIYFVLVFGLWALSWDYQY